MELVVYEVKSGKCQGEGNRSVWKAKEEGSFLWKHSVNVYGGIWEKGR